MEILRCKNCNCAHKSYCKKYDNRIQRHRRKRDLNKNTLKYERTFKGKIMRTYNNMTNRVKGLSKPHLYKGLDIISREDFYEFSFNDKSYNHLFDKWVKSEYNRKISPSIDRVNSDIGYIKGNIRWITHSENSKLTKRWSEN